MRHTPARAQFLAERAYGRRSWLDAGSAVFGRAWRCSWPVALPMPPAGAAEPLAAVAVERYGGSDRYETSPRVAEAVAANAGGTLDTVVLISGTNWTNAVLGAPLAAQLGGTVLATPPHRLREDAAEFLERVGVRQAWLVRADNDVAAISTDVDFALPDIGTGIEITRVSGPDHYSVSTFLAITSSWRHPSQRHRRVSRIRLRPMPLFEQQGGRWVSSRAWSALGHW